MAKTSQFNSYLQLGNILKQELNTIKHVVFTYLLLIKKAIYCKNITDMESAKNDIFFIIINKNGE